MKSILIFLFLLTPYFSAQAYTPGEAPMHGDPKEFDGVGLDLEKLGKSIDTSLKFTNEDGEEKPLSAFLASGIPAFVSIVYYNCPGLCNLHMNGFAKALTKLQLKADDQYQWLLVSMDHSEGFNLAKKKKSSYIEKFPVQNSNKGWNFLTGSEENVKALTDQLGFGFRWDDNTEQFAHAAAVYVLDKSGLISRIIPGIEFEPKTLKLSIIEASKGKVGDILDKIVMFCFQFDPAKNKYTLAAFNLMRAGGVLILVLLAFLILPVWIKQFKEQGVPS